MVVRITIGGSEQFADLAHDFEKMSEDQKELVAMTVKDSAERVKKSWSANFKESKYWKGQSGLFNTEMSDNSVGSVEYQVGPLPEWLTHIAMWGGSRGGGHRQQPEFYMLEESPQLIAAVQKIVNEVHL